MRICFPVEPVAVLSKQAFRLVWLTGLTDWFDCAFWGAAVQLWCVTAECHSVVKRQRFDWFISVFTA